MSRKREPETAEGVDTNFGAYRSEEERGAAFERWCAEREKAGRARGSCSLSDNCDMGRIWKPESVTASHFVLCAEHRERVEAEGKRVQRAEAGRRLS
jgi:hypothetical protein